ncbi:hypothetical protein [Desulfuromonas sp. AOP6]|uniref:hypothetical protein n=1 Tax=Desulfuromonas sp. AOP6 TaxID=1566351 RepID=UPI00127DC09C|nr:hypothetical protein [Desulfuromonas sp. AOP6]BCA79506.1 hypothetical protein AOP6_1293 [Desulfuromonas sp. AOP6]
MLKLFKVSFWSVLILFLSQAAFAAPTVNAVNSVTNSSLVIQGAGFGIKVPAEPLLWENFERGVDGSFLATDPKWKNYSMNATNPKYSAAMVYSGNLAGHGRAFPNSPAPGNEEDCSAYFTFDGQDALYASYYSYVKLGGPFQGTGKFARFNSQSAYTGVPSFITQTTAAAYSYPTINTGSGGPTFHNIGFKMAQNKWNRMEMFEFLSTPGGAKNGIVELNENNGPNLIPASFDGITRASGISSKLNIFLLPLMWANLTGENYADMYVDDVYIDITRARVEIGNAINWHDCTTREVQIPSAWTNNSITVSLNLGRLKEDEKKFLFVVDSNGDMNTIGFPVTINGSGEVDPITPGLEPAQNLRDVPVQ